VTPRVLFVYKVPAPFVLQDKEGLSLRTPVKDFRWSDHRHPARQLVRWMVQHRRDFDVVLAWFGDTHATVATKAARLLGKPSIIVVGGYDVSDEPGYGFLALPGGLRRARAHFRRATRIAAVSRSLADQLSLRFPEVAEKTVVLPTGVDVDRFRPNGPRERKVLSVAAVDEPKRAWMKGLDRIVAIAKLLPDVPFVILGPSPQAAQGLGRAANLEIRPAIPHAGLVAEYQSAAVYVQASRSEGLPNAVMEAMACGCVPVVTRVGGMPELVGDAGFVVEDDLDALSAGVRRALDDTALQVRARQRIVEHYSMRQREAGLLELLSSVANESAP